MTHYFIRTCDNAGQVVEDCRVDVGDVDTALAIANRRFGLLMDRSDIRLRDSIGRIDVADREGTTVARLICAEAIAARS
ncbi:MAG TPA: hypothetical protein VF637_05385 [Sphingomicrobium sp.]|jgi:hypothetical protein